MFRASDVSGAVAHNVSMDIRSGEIVALTGAIGGWSAQLARVVFGADRGTGRMELAGCPLHHGRPDKKCPCGRRLCER